MKKTLAKIIGITISIMLILQSSQVLAVTQKELERQKQEAQSKAQ